MTDNKRASVGFSFNVQAKKKRKISSSKSISIFEEEKTEEKEKGEVILSISDGGVRSANPQKKEKPLVIPLGKDINTGKIGIKKNQDHLMLAKIARGENVEMEDAKSDNENDEFDGEIIPSKMEDIDTNLPLLLRNRRLELEEIKDENERFRADIADRPDASSLDDYNRVPVSKFGEALLRGMDWKPGMKIGMNDRGLVKPIEFIPRPRGLGLGADASQQKEKRKRKDDKPTKVLAPDADGKQRHYRNLDEKLVSSDKIKKKSNESEINYNKKEEKQYNTWMRRGIIVRIVSKSFKSGIYYRERVKIIDVIDDKHCDVLFEGKVLEGVKERMIETALPKAGGYVMVLCGRNSGRIGILKSRNSKKNEAVVEFRDDKSSRSYDFEDVAEYDKS